MQEQSRPKRTGKRERKHKHDARSEPPQPRRCCAFSRSGPDKLPDRERKEVLFSCLRIPEILIYGHDTGIFLPQTYPSSFPRAVQPDCRGRSGGTPGQRPQGACGKQPRRRSFAYRNRAGRRRAQPGSRNGRRTRHSFRRAGTGRHPACHQQDFRY